MDAGLLDGLLIELYGEGDRGMGGLGIGGEAPDGREEAREGAKMRGSSCVETTSHC